MENFNWTPFRNEYSKVAGQKATDEKLIYTITPAIAPKIGVTLKIVDQYTGMGVKTFDVLDMDAALHKARWIHHKIKLGWSIQDVVDGN